RLAGPTLARRLRSQRPGEPGFPAWLIARTTASPRPAAPVARWRPYARNGPAPLWGVEPAGTRESARTLEPARKHVVNPTPHPQDGSMVRPEVLDYYRRGGERDRLTTDAGKLEFLRTWDVLTRELPPAPTTLLDVGGATGGYAAPLAERGYREPVVDPVTEHVAEAAARPRLSAVVGDARGRAVHG